MKSSQHLHKISTSPFDYLNFETRHLDKRTVDHHKQTSNQGIPAQDEIKSVQSREALSQYRNSKRCHISKKNLIWTEEGKHTIVQKLVPVVQVVFPGCVLEGGVVGAPVYYLSVECSVISGYVLKTP
jgi:hypothetical protein